MVDMYEALSDGAVSLPKFDITDLAPVTVHFEARPACGRTVLVGVDSDLFTSPLYILAAGLKFIWV